MAHPDRRLSDKIITAHAQACAEGKLEVADTRLRALEIDLSAIGGKPTENRDATEVLEAAFKRHQEARQKS